MLRFEKTEKHIKVRAVLDKDTTLSDSNNFISRSYFSHMGCIKGARPFFQRVYRWFMAFAQKSTTGTTSTSSSIMPSKGVDYYSYIALPSTSIVFSGPKVGSTTTSTDNFAKRHLEIESGNLPWYTFVGTFEWDVSRDGTGDLQSQAGDQFTHGQPRFGRFHDDDEYAGRGWSGLYDRLRILVSPFFFKKKKVLRAS